MKPTIENCIKYLSKNADKIYPHQIAVLLKEVEKKGLEYKEKPQ